MFLYPDNPMPISLEMLQRIDRDPPGTWLAQPKMDGWRRIASQHAGRWTWRAKPAGSGSLKPLPAALQAEFKALPWPDDLTLDMEWTGPRLVENNLPATLWVFDLLEYGEPMHEIPFCARILLLHEIMQTCHAAHVHVVDAFPNPGLCDRFAEQMTNPLSEGLVIRRADSKIIGHRTKCVDNPFNYKCKYRDIRERKY